MIIFDIYHFFFRMAICTGKFRVFFSLYICLTFYNINFLTYWSPLLIKDKKFLKDQSMPICERGAFCYQTTTTYQPDSPANQSNLLYKWKLGLTFGRESPFSIKACAGKVIRLECSGFPHTVTPRRHPSAAILCRFLRVLTGSSTIMITKLAIILSNLYADSIGSSALAALSIRFCLLHHSSTVYFTPILSRYFFRFYLVRSIIFQQRSVAMQVVYVSLEVVAKGSSLPVPHAIQRMCLADLRLSMLTRVQKKVCMQESTALQPSAKPFH